MGQKITRRFEMFDFSHWILLARRVKGGRERGRGEGYWVTVICRIMARALFFTEKILRRRKVFVFFFFAFNLHISEFFRFRFNIDLQHPHTRKWINIWKRKCENFFYILDFFYIGNAFVMKKEGKLGKSQEREREREKNLKINLRKIQMVVV